MEINQASATRYIGAGAIIDGTPRVKTCAPTTPTAIAPRVHQARLDIPTTISEARKFDRLVWVRAGSLHQYNRATAMLTKAVVDSVPLKVSARGQEQMLRYALVKCVARCLLVWY